MEGLPVQGQPALYSVGVDGGDLVGDRDVGVQVGVAGAGVSKAVPIRPVVST